MKKPKTITELKQVNQKGFTILELMIATSVLAIMLLMVTVIMMNIANLYDKGVNVTNVQDSTRDAINQIAQDIQASSGNIIVGQTYSSGYSSLTPPINNAVKAYCIGNIRYSYIVGYAEGTGVDDSMSPSIPQIPHVLWRDTITDDSSSCNALNLNTSSPSGNGTELVDANTRITDFSISKNQNGAYVISLAEAYGNRDYISSYSPSATPPSATFNPECKTITGDQYCATEALSLIVQPRLPNNN